MFLCVRTYIVLFLFSCASDATAAPRLQGDNWRETICCCQLVSHPSNICITIFGSNGPCKEQAKNKVRHSIRQLLEASEDGTKKSIWRFYLISWNMHLTFRTENFILTKRFFLNCSCVFLLHTYVVLFLSSRGCASFAVVQVEYWYS
jgi:hypothetical protein